MSKPYIDNFLKHVSKTEECWIWNASKDRKGYGYFAVNRRTKRAHRVSWEIHFGEIPKGMFVCHSCDNPSCVNPAHLFIGSNIDNVTDMVSKGRQTYGEKNPSSKLTEEQVLSIRSLATKMSKSELSEKFSISKTQIHYILSGERWSHVPFPVF